MSMCKSGRARARILASVCVCESPRACAREQCMYVCMYICRENVSTVVGFIDVSPRWIGMFLSAYARTLPRADVHARRLRTRR